MSIHITHTCASQSRAYFSINFNKNVLCRKAIIRFCGYSFAWTKIHMTYILVIILNVYERAYIINLKLKNNNRL